MNIKGYVHVALNAAITSNGACTEFQGRILRVMDWAEDGSALVINSQATAIASIDMKDILRGFKCDLIGSVLVPPGLSMTEQLVYVGRVMTRKGGYNDDVMKLSIVASLAKGEVHDSHLFN